LAAVALHLVQLPLALGGETGSSGETTAAGVLTIISIVAVVIVLAGVWYFFFRDHSDR
jgi:hypothetical protein